MSERTLRVGDVTVIALCDGATDYHSDITVAYPAVPAEAWAPWRERYPTAFAASGTWRLHVHCYAIRTPGGTVLVDTGVGPPEAPAASWFGGGGRLPEELAEAGVEPDEVVAVVLTHAHDDHVGWNLDGDGLRFRNARYLMRPEDLDFLRTRDEEEDRRVLAETLDGLGEALVLAESDQEVAPGVRLIHTPGHTPGHQSVLVASGGGVMLVTGDVANHPAFITETGWAAGSDADPALAAATRAEVVARAAEEGWRMATGHFAEPYGEVTRDEDGRTWWRPVSAEL
jgi:glyoxylase-like metal-dependent hydrolase (beta-lactamase superfamily II)